MNSKRVPSGDQSGKSSSAEAGGSVICCSPLPSVALLNSAPLVSEGSRKRLNAIRSVAGGGPYVSRDEGGGTGDVEVGLVPDPAVEATVVAVLDDPLPHAATVQATMPTNAAGARSRRLERGPLVAVLVTSLPFPPFGEPLVAWPDDDGSQSVAVGADDVDLVVWVLERVSDRVHGEHDGTAVWRPDRTDWKLAR